MSNSNAAQITIWSNCYEDNGRLFSDVVEVLIDRPVADVLRDHGIYPSAFELGMITGNGGYENDYWLVQIREKGDLPLEGRHELDETLVEIHRPRPAALAA